MTPNAAKKVIRAEIERLGLPKYRLTAQTLAFADPALGSGIFVEIHDWKSDEKWNELERKALSSGFHLSPGKVYLSSQ